MVRTRQECPCNVVSGKTLRFVADSTRSYFKQLRTAVSKRLAPRLYFADGTPNKFWMAFAKRKFMNKELS